MRKGLRSKLIPPPEGTSTGVPNISPEWVELSSSSTKHTSDRNRMIVSQVPGVVAETTVDINPPTLLPLIQPPEQKLQHQNISRCGVPKTKLEVDAFTVEALATPIIPETPANQTIPLLHMYWIF